MAVGDILTYPAAAAGVVVAGNATTPWTDGTTVTLVPASTITVPQNFLGLWVQSESSYGPDTSYQAIFRLKVSGTEKLVIPHVFRFDTAVGCFLSSLPPPTTPELYQIPADALVEVTVAASTTTQDDFRVKMMYVVGAVAGTGSLIYQPSSLYQMRG